MATGINFCTDGSLKVGAGGGQALGGGEGGTAACHQTAPHLPWKCSQTPQGTAGAAAQQQQCMEAQWGCRWGAMGRGQGMVQTAPMVGSRAVCDALSPLGLGMGCDPPPSAHSAV